MNFKEYEDLEKSEDNLITEDDLTNLSDRTLIYGYTCERELFHVYLKDRKIYTVVYGGTSMEPINLRSISVVVNQQYLPSKRITAECCDYEFCRLLQKAGCILRFDGWDDQYKLATDNRVFHGYVCP